MVIPEPVFKNRIPGINWLKIYSREYGVQYSEMAILCLSTKAGYHIPHPSVDQIVIPDGTNTAFYIDKSAWEKLVKSLNDNYTSNSSKLAAYEKQFNLDGKNYFEITKELSHLNLGELSNQKLLTLYKAYQKKLFTYSVFAWTSFILNDFVSQRAKKIIDKYIKTHFRESERQKIYNSLFKPDKKAAVLLLSEEANKLKGKYEGNNFNRLYQKYKWMSCLDIHNKPWTVTEFKSHLKSLSFPKNLKVNSLNKYAEELKVSQKDLEYLSIARQFVYIKDARDDYRRQGVYLAGKFFQELSKRMKITLNEFSLLQEDDVIGFLAGKLKIDRKILSDRKKGFILYLDRNNKLTCLTGDDTIFALSSFNFKLKDDKEKVLKGMVASSGFVQGNVVIVRGVKDLAKVKEGNILVAASTHPDYVPAMRKAGAVITDEGGITSHAAIVCREFGIPCIVGTKNATKILRDGDMVGINGNSGLIKILI